jgi:tRNA-dihydrouridine synthase B
LKQTELERARVDQKTTKQTLSEQAMKPLRFGHLVIWPPFVAAPFAGYTDGVYREILREFGCPYCYTEMVSAKGLVMGGEATLALLEHSEHDRPLAVQLFGSEPEDISEAIRAIHQADVPFDAVDINMGCPAKKVTSQGAGGALLKDISRAEAMIQAAKSATRLPVSVKIRIGWSGGERAVEIASRLEAAGADMIAVHGRTVAQGYSGEADWGTIARVARSLNIPVVGNGDVTAPRQGLKLLGESGCSGIMVGRGILGNPFFFRSLYQTLRGSEPEPAAAGERFTLAIDHLHRAAQRYGERRAMLELRKHLAFYFKGMKGASKLRTAMNGARSWSELVDTIRHASRCFGNELHM